MARKTEFQLVFPENIKRGNNLSTTETLSFDDLGDFVEEREKISRALERVSETKLKVDYSDFANHVFFDSAQTKFNIVYNKILNEYPYNGNAEEKDAFILTGSGYENYILEQWPRFVGYARLNGTSTQFISASDVDKKLVFGTSSFMLSSHIRYDTSSSFAMIINVLSGSSPTAGGARMFFSADGQVLHFQMQSGSTLNQLNYPFVTNHGTGSTWHNVALMYDRQASRLAAYVNGNRVLSQSVTYGPIEQNEIVVHIGGGPGFGAFSGAINEVRVYMTASELLLQKHYNRPIDAEEYLALHYKFNEGITETGSIDEVIVDYSKSGVHGKFLNYNTSMRVSGAVLLRDPGDLILYNFHSAVKNFSASISLSASTYDRNNNNLILNLIPEGVLIEDENADNLLKAFSLAMARFFDNLKLYIDQFINLKVTNYQDVDETPDLFLPYLQRYFGWKVTEHFGSSNPLEFFFGEGVLSTGSLDVSLFEIRNQFWRRILNNLPYLLKTKGKRHNLDAFFNVLGVGNNNFSLKEYGYLPGGSIEDSRIHQSKPVALLGIGTGSLSSSFVKVQNLVASPLNEYTVETLLQLPNASASYNGTELTGSVWQFVDPEQVTGSFSLVWNVASLENHEGKFVLTSSDGQRFSSSLVSVFDGDFVHVAAGRGPNGIPFIEVRTLDNDEIDFSASYTGSVALDGVFTGSNYHFIIGASSGSIFTHKAQGFFSQVKVWNRKLSGSEIDDHALNFESVGLRDPAEEPNPLRGYWPLNENKSTDSGGNLNLVQDLSRNGRVATGSLFLTSHNPYKKFLLEYNYLSPAIDLKWSENKIRVRNKTELTINEVARDTNEVSLEFNLIDTLNRDISKIFSSFDILNNAIGSPVNKYRDEYSDLEAYRRAYFDRLGDSIHFTNFFKLFKWFDKKLSDSIKQLLPSRVKFIGGEQVVESHMLERPRYGFKYPIFRTPVDIPNADLSGSPNVDGEKQQIYPNSPPALLMGTTTADNKEKVERLWSGFRSNPVFSTTLDETQCFLLLNDFFNSGSNFHDSATRLIYNGVRNTTDIIGRTVVGNQLETAISASISSGSSAQLLHNWNWEQSTNVGTTTSASAEMPSYLNSLCLNNRCFYLSHSDTNSFSDYKGGGLDIYRVMSNSLGTGSSGKTLISGTVEFWYKSEFSGTQLGGKVVNLNVFDIMVLQDQPSVGSLFTAKVSYFATGSSSAIRFTWRTASTTTTTDFDMNPSDGWHHYAVSWRSTPSVNINFYVDGVVRAAGTSLPSLVSIGGPSQVQYAAYFGSASLSNKPTAHRPPCPGWYTGIRWRDRYYTDISNTYLTYLSGAFHRAFPVTSRESSVVSSVDMSPQFVSTYSEGADKVDKLQGYDEFWKAENPFILYGYQMVEDPNQDAPQIYDVQVHDDGTIYGLMKGFDSDSPWFKKRIIKSHISAAYDWSIIEGNCGLENNPYLAVDPRTGFSNRIYLAGISSSDTDFYHGWNLMRSDDCGLTWNRVDYLNALTGSVDTTRWPHAHEQNGTNVGQIEGVCVDYQGRVYTWGISGTVAQMNSNAASYATQNCLWRRSETGNSGTFTTLSWSYGSDGRHHIAQILPAINERIYLLCTSPDGPGSGSFVYGFNDNLIASGTGTAKANSGSFDHLSPYGDIWFDNGLNFRNFPIDYTDQVPMTRMGRVDLSSSLYFYVFNQASSHGASIYRIRATNENYGNGREDRSFIASSQDYKRKNGKGSDFNQDYWYFNTVYNYEVSRDGKFVYIMGLTGSSFGSGEEALTVLRCSASVGSVLNNAVEILAPRASWVDFSASQVYELLDMYPEETGSLFFDYYKDLNEGQEFYSMIIDPNKNDKMFFFGWGFDPNFNEYAIIRSQERGFKRGFFRVKVSGDSDVDSNNANSSINSRNESVRRILTNRDRDNE